MEANESILYSGGFSMFFGLPREFVNSLNDTNVQDLGTPFFCQVDKKLSFTVKSVSRQFAGESPDGETPVI